MKSITIFSLLALVSLHSLNANEEIIKKEAKEAIKQMANTLKANVKKSMKKGGVVEVAKFCSQKAKEIEYNVNKSYKKGVNVKRISLKYRNLADKPTKNEEEVLKNLQKTFEQNQKLPPLVVKKVDKDTYKVYKPIFIAKKLCLKCHGDIKTRDKEAYKIIKRAYPKDKAIDYKMGDLRGAFVATIKYHEDKK